MKINLRKKKIVIIRNIISCNYKKIAFSCGYARVKVDYCGDYSN